MTLFLIPVLYIALSAVMGNILPPYEQPRAVVQEPIKTTPEVTE